MTTYIRLKNGKINAYRQEPFNMQKGYEYIETEIQMDEYCYYDSETNSIMRKSQEEIDLILQARIYSEKQSRINTALAHINKELVLMEDDNTRVEEYRSIKFDSLDYLTFSEQDFLDFEYRVLAFELSRNNILSGSETLEDLQNLYNDSQTI